MSSVLDSQIFNGSRRLSLVEMDAKEKVEEVFESTTAEDLLESTEEEFVQEVMNEVEIEIPDIDFEDWEPRTSGEGGKRKLEIPLSYEGDAELLEIPPSNHDPQNLTARVTAGTLTFSFDLNDLDSDDPQGDIEESLNHLEEGLEALQEELQELKEEIQDDVRNEFRERKEQAKENEKKLEKLDFPSDDQDE
ncbi:hypothetical protein [Halorubrum sp. AJ67]|uniref:hypothetical protein n=1 Tax=Halorubrum sp. AJ67 TaxID=1173487 RepID=UPI0003DB78E5|nr:hypothetical protein [Halorubrum sp. AJ67]CDK39504.1 hypothetical protein BN903_56 [Halorubrum sp. AJ67]